MGYKIVVDSGCEITEDMRAAADIAIVPLTLEIGTETITDDGAMSQQEIITRIAAASNCPKTACPSPEAYADKYAGEADRVYVVTLSAALSGSYASANVAKAMYEEEHPEAQVYVFNSRSASVGETLIVRRIMELEAEGLSFEEVIAETEVYIDGMKTYFVLDNLETLRKNGRLSGLKALAANMLQIKPICVSTADGQIEQIDQARGIKRAVEKMAAYVAKAQDTTGRRRFGISHCNALDRAHAIRERLMMHVRSGEAVFAETGGLSTVYANDGGIIMAI
ncbi:MAG: DegV family protein [Lachnospiraceae bacterium]|nr:DegV family protein [Lachnospiraceae bacterium]